MYQTCPKCGHQRVTDDPAPATECPACGIVFEKWLRTELRRRAEADRPVPERSHSDAPFLSRLVGAVCYVPEQTHRTYFYCRVVLYLVLLVWGWRFIFMDYYTVVGGAEIQLTVPEIGTSIMHWVNIPFHEFGHILFHPFGETVMYLGGTLGQWLMPLAVVLVFLIRERDTFAASVGLWWLGQSFLDCVPYIYDASHLQLQLIGGGAARDGRVGLHDWYNILRNTELLHKDDTIAAVVDHTGAGILMLSFAWGATVLWRQYRNL